jgi:transcriptional regulator with XRE-family HTH domain
VAKQNPSLRRRLGIVLRDARLDAELSQEEVAARAGVHPTYISLLGRGLSSPSLDTLTAIAAALGTKAHILVDAAER